MMESELTALFRSCPFLETASPSAVWMPWRSCWKGSNWRAGLDVFGIGEHHRKEFLDSAPAVILAVAAARTKHIRLTSTGNRIECHRSGQGIFIFSMMTGIGFVQQNDHIFPLTQKVFNSLSLTCH
jgi:hypothetical protein